MTPPLTPAQRGRRVADDVLDAIAPRLALNLGPVDLDALAAAVAREVEEAVAERVVGTLFAKEMA